MKNKIVKISLVAFLTVLVTTSCKKSFLDEKLETVRDLSFYNTAIRLTPKDKRVEKFEGGGFGILIYPTGTRS